ncbi:MAG: hypothetical protein R3211_08320 [Balneolaceae bacterium]|nr:hypothetical protein [Balneolaceae bacterium]
MKNLDGFFTYDHLLHEPLKNRGWKAIPVPWRSSDVNWNQFEAVIIRSPWDYQDDPGRFLDLLRTIDRSTAHLENDLKLVLWNIKKSYLFELEKRGIPIVPTFRGDNFRSAVPDKFFEQFNTEEIVIKPVVGANADDTYRLNRNTLHSFLPELKKKFRHREFIVQPFMDRIISEGEYSLFYFDKKYSHAILKTPKEHDFRVQEEHGGILQNAEATGEMLDIGERMLETLSPTPLYSRIDLVRDSDGSFALMEVELIEPSLYFNMDPDAAELFADLFDRRMKKLKSLKS